MAPNIYEIIHEKIHFFARFYQKNKKYFLMRHKALIFRHFTDRQFSSNSPMRRAARFSMRHPIHITDCFLQDLRSYARTLMCNYTLKTDFCRHRGHNLRAPRRILPESAGNLLTDFGFGVGDNLLADSGAILANWRRQCGRFGDDLGNVADSAIL